MRVQGLHQCIAEIKMAGSQTRIIVLECLTALGIVTIKLPKIADLRKIRALQVEFVIADFDGQASVNKIEVQSDPADSIEGNPSFDITTDNEVKSFKIAGNKWYIH